MPITGKFLADFESFYAAVQKAEVQLRGMETGAGKVSKSLNAMVDSFSGRKLVQDATLAAEAVDRIGGVSKLTESELQRLGAQAGQAIEKLRAMGETIPPGIQRIADAAKGANKETSGWLNDFATQLTATAAGFVSAQAVIGGVTGAIRGLAGFVASSVHAFAEAESSQKKMTAALVAQGRATPDVIRQYNDLAATFQNTTAFSDDLINRMQSLLIEVGGVMPGEMQKALQASTDLAAGLGIDLESATKLVGKAFAGETGTLARYGIVIDELKFKAQGMPYVLGLIQQKFGGQAAAEVETYSGKVKQLANEWNNVQEAVGMAVAKDPFVIAALRGLTDSARDASHSADGLGVTITDLWAKLAGVDPAGMRFLHWLESTTDQSNKAADGLKKLAEIKPAISHVTQQEAEAAAIRKRMADEKKAEEERKKAEEEAIRLAKEHAQALKELAEHISGVDVAKKIADLNTALNMAARSGPLTADGFKIVADAADQLFRAGGRLTPQLMKIAIESGELSPKLVPINDTLKDLVGQIDVTIPEMEKIWEQINKLAPDRAVVGISNLKEQFAALVVVSPETMLKGVEKKAHDVGKAIDELSKAFAQLAEITGGSLGAILKQFGEFVAAADIATKGLKAFHEGQKALKDGSTLAGISGITAGITGIASAAIEAAKAIKNLFFGTAGRDAVKDFAATFQTFNLDTLQFNPGGGFDELHKQLLAISDPSYGEKLWKALTQGVGRNNPEQAKAVIDLITKALQDQKSAINAIADASIDAGTAQSAATQKALDAIKGMDDQIKSLNDSIASEAPEEVMGVIESNTRAQIAALEKQRAEAQKALDDAAGDTQGAIAAGADNAAQLTVERIREELDAADFHLRVHVDLDGLPSGLSIPGSVPGFATGTQGKYLDFGAGTLAMLHGRERVVTANEPAAAAGSGPIIVQVMLPDGRVLAEAVVPHIPAVVDGYGIGVNR